MPSPWFFAQALKDKRREKRCGCFLPGTATRYNAPPMFDRRYFVYIVQSASRRALYIGFTNLLIMRVIEHRMSEYSGSFTSKYRAWRLMYYEECGDAEAAKDPERQLKGW